MGTKLENNSAYCFDRAQSQRLCWDTKKMVVVNRSGYVMNSIVCDGLNIFNTTSCVIVIIHKMHLCGYNSLIEKEVSILGWFCSATHRRSFLAWSGAIEFGISVV